MRYDEVLAMVLDQMEGTHLPRQQIEDVVRDEVAREEQARTPDPLPWLGPEPTSQLASLISLRLRREAEVLRAVEGTIAARAALASGLAALAELERPGSPAARAFAVACHRAISSAERWPVPPARPEHVAEAERAYRRADDAAQWATVFNKLQAEEEWRDLVAASPLSGAAHALRLLEERPK